MFRVVRPKLAGRLRCWEVRVLSATIVLVHLIVAKTRINIRAHTTHTPQSLADTLPRRVVSRRSSLSVHAGAISRHVAGRVSHHGFDNAFVESLAILGTWFIHRRHSSPARVASTLPG